MDTQHGIFEFQAVMVQHYGLSIKNFIAALSNTAIRDFALSSRAAEAAAWCCCLSCRAMIAIHWAHCYARAAQTPKDSQGKSYLPCKLKCKVLSKFSKCTFCAVHDAINLYLSYPELESFTQAQSEKLDK